MSRPPTRYFGELLAVRFPTLTSIKLVTRCSISVIFRCDCKGDIVF
jgi:hypothetical protein